MNEEIAEALRQLHEDNRLRVERFDPGPDFDRRIAILPSAFNPPTLAHLRLLELAREVDGIAGAAAMLSTRNVDKGLHGAQLHDRVGMLLALHEPNPELAVLASNAARIMDQAGALRGQNPGIGFDFIVGFDTLIRVFDPSYYLNMAADLEPFFNDHRLIATNRARWTVDQVEAFLETPVVRDFAERIIVRELEPEPARHSSTEERTSIEQGKTPIGLAPEVTEYIRRRRLYQDSTNSP